MHDTICKPPAAAVAPAPTTPRSASRGWRILLAEDHPINQKIVVGILEKDGHTVTVANNGKEAVAAWKRQAFDIVLMDLEMPEMGGLEAAALIRRGETNGRRLPILAVTSCATEEDKEQCRTAGMDGHVAKPVNAVFLLQSMRNLLEKKPVAKERRSKPTQHDAPYDHQELLERVDGNLLMLRDIAQMLLEDCPQWMSEIADSIRQRDARRLKMAAHTLSGAVANFGAFQAQEAGRALEAMGRAGDLAEAAHVFTALENAIERLRPALSKLVESPAR